MNNDFESISKIVKNIKLSNQEKMEMHDYILQNVDLSKTSIGNGFESFSSRIYYQIKNNNFMFNQKKLISAFIIVVMVVAIGGTSAYAEKSIPGDFLYSFKVYVNEPAAGLFALTKEEKTEWKERIVERRLNEAQKLISKNDLDEIKRIELENKIKEKVNEFNTNLNELALEKNQSINSSELNIRLQASLSAYGGVLSALKNDKNTDEDTKNETGKFLASLSESNKEIRDNHKDIELNLKIEDSKVSDENENPSDLNKALAKQNVAENLLNSIKLLYQKEKIDLSSNIQTQINNKLALIETTLDEGKASSNSTDYTKAIEKFQDVINGINGAKLLMLSNIIKTEIEEDDDSDDLYEDIEGDEIHDTEDGKLENDDRSTSVQKENTKLDDNKNNSVEFEEDD